MGIELKGVDVSTWQGSGLDFKKLKKKGINFAILRAGYGSSGKKDAQFENYYAKAQKAGMPVGAYWYSYAMDAKGAAAEAQACINVLKGKQFEYPIYYDLEDPSQSNLSKDTKTEILTTFCSVLEKAGYFVGIYSSLSWLVNEFDYDKIKRYSIWVAQWAQNPTYDKPFGMWQYGLNQDLNIDGDICYEDFPTIIKNAGLNGFTKLTSTTPEDKGEEVNKKQPATPKSKKFTPRFTPPSETDKYWISIAKKGLNECIEVNKDNGSCLPNCVGYAWGRAYELLESKSDLSKYNAEMWYGNTADGYKRSQTPTLGAIVCWSKGQVGNGADGAGHVAVVEQIRPNGDIVTSNSAYGGTRFYLKVYEKKSNYEFNGYKFQGFIQLPAEFTGINNASYKTTTQAVVDDVIAGRYGNYPERVANLLAAGYDYDEVQKYVEEQIKSQPTASLKIGDRVKIKAGSRWATGENVPNWVTQLRLYVRSAITDGTCLVSTLSSGAITGRAYVKDLVKE